MADLQQIIQKIMSDPKIASSRNFTDRVYSDEPILIPAPQMERFTPPKIREMRKMAWTGGSEAEIFYKQGKFMEAFEDDFAYHGEFSRYFPTYQSMSDAQLRGYFSWRAKVRGGTVEKTSLSFAFVHIYELLNQIGVRAPEDGFGALKRFWLAYREIDSRIDSYAALWLKDYVVYNSLDKSFLKELPDAVVDNAVGVLLNHKSHDPASVFAALVSLSSYDLENSRFFKQCPEDVKNVVCRVFSVVSDYYGRNASQTAREKFFGKVCANPYSMFKSAVFHFRPMPGERVYEIGDGHRYVYGNGGWCCERFAGYGRNNKRIGALLKSVDYLMRQSRGFKSTLQPGKTNKTIQGKIEKEIAKYEQEKMENAPPKIDIDVAKLQTIRISALATQNRLLVDEPEEEPPVAAAGEESGPEHGGGLGAVERLFVQRLLYGGNCEEVARSRGLMLSVLVDGVNEKLFDAFNDTVIADEEGCPVVIEDYREELKGMFPQ